ncbi:MAG: alkaline phosphatase family protein [Bacteroidaceae bacterium]|nr:alkaline phosphatase family protein [Bacteroidaceae bacterium]
MRIGYCLILFLLGCVTSFAQQEVKSPKLYINITVDQLRSDFLYEFSSLYCEGGFKRLLSGGKVFQNSYYQFENIDRASATASLSSGTAPYVNGIVGERWLDRSSLRIVNCVEDHKHQGVYTNTPMSPSRLKAITITDELKRATRGKAIVCSIAPDEDAAVLAGGHAADHVLWKNNSTGYWCSSSYYGLYPQWAADKNKVVRGRSSKWTPLFPTEKYNNFGDEAPEAFSYSFNGLKDIRTYKTTACINDEVNEMAKAFLDNTLAGRDDIADCLSLTYYAGNYNGNPMEERPIEIQDIYARLDRNIADLLDYADKLIGMENVVVSVASTGYVVENGDDGAKYRLPSGKIYMDRVEGLLNVYLTAQFGKGDYIEGVYGGQLYLNRKAIENLKLDKLDVVSHTVEFLKSMDGVEDVFTIYRLGGMLSPEMQYVKNGYNPSSSGDVWLRLMPGWKVFSDVSSEANTTLRTPVMFPMIIYGGGTAARVVEDMTPSNVLAAEMARILRIRRPNDNSLRVF